MLISLSLDLNNLFVPQIRCTLHSISVAAETSELVFCLNVSASTFKVLKGWVKQGRALSLSAYKPFND